jgi:hypothetical protein
LDHALLHAFLREHGATLPTDSDSAINHHSSGNQLSSSRTLPPSIEHVHPADLAAMYAVDPLLSSSVSSLASFDWVLGSNPDFSHEHSARLGSGWGSVTLSFRVGRGGRIEAAKAYSDALVAPMVDEVNAALDTLVAQPIAAVAGEISSSASTAAATAAAVYSRDNIDAALARAEQACRSKLGEEAASQVHELREWMATQL